MEEASRIAVCCSTADNYDTVLTLQDDDTMFVCGWWGTRLFVDRLRIRNARGDVLGLQIQVSLSPVMLGTVPWALSIIYEHFSLQNKFYLCSGKAWLHQASRIVVCHSTADNYDTVSTLQDDNCQ
jgi:hypothetical protein